MKNILLQTTIPYIENDWHISRFSILAEHLSSLTGDAGNPLYKVTTRDREIDAAGNDLVLSRLDTLEFDELWLFAVDTGDGLTVADCEAITKFRQQGGGILSTRDHFDLGSSLCTIGGVGAAHYFNSKNPDPDPERHRRDDEITTSIDFPNYHSGANGDYQTIVPLVEHELLKRKDGSTIKYFPAHPHEGGIGAPEDDPSAQVIAVGTSKVTDRQFNLIVAFENSTDAHGNGMGRAIADSSFHHLADYNFNPSAGCPDFVEEVQGNGYQENPAALVDIKTFIENAAQWLAPRQNREQ